MASERPANQAIAAQWRMARRLFPFYAAAATQFRLADPPFKSLAEIDQSAESEALDRVFAWFDQMDDKMEVHQLRQVLQTTTGVGGEERLHHLLERFLQKQQKTATDRDKLDFLLAQYFNTCAPPSFHDRDVSLEDVAGVLEPVLGELPSELPTWLHPLEELIDSLRACRTLQELQEKEIIERGRELKLASRSMYFGRTALLAFTRFNYVLRRNFYRLLNSDLQAISEGLEELDKKNIQRLDCTALKLSADEPVANLRQICQYWKRPQVADYAIDQTFGRVAALRKIVDDALSTQPRSDEDENEERFAEIERKLAESTRQISTLQVLLEDMARRIDELSASVPSRETASLSNPDHVLDLDDEPAPARGSHTNGRPNGKAPQAAHHAPNPRATGPSVHSPGNEMLEKVISKVGAQIMDSKQKRGGPTATVTVAGTVLLLSDPEANSFVNPETDREGLLRRAVAARALLVEKIEAMKKGGNAGDLFTAIDVAQEEAERLENVVASAGDDQWSEPISNARRALRQLRTVLRHAETQSGSAAAAH